jgi:hypothetical protein
MRARTGNSQPAFYGDGLRVSQLMEAGIDEFLRPDMIEGVEFYTGSASLPSGFEAPNTCGAVLFWSRRGDSASVLSLTRILAAGAALLLVLGSAPAW